MAPTSQPFKVHCVNLRLMDCREKISALALHAEADSFEEELSAELAGGAEAGNARSRLVAIWMASRRLDLLFS